VNQQHWRSAVEAIELGHPSRNRPVVPYPDASRQGQAGSPSQRLTKFSRNENINN
jgi:hypothetical protein